MVRNIVKDNIKKKKYIFFLLSASCREKIIIRKIDSLGVKNGIGSIMAALSLGCLETRSKLIIVSTEQTEYSIKFERLLFNARSVGQNKLVKKTKMFI